MTSTHAKQLLALSIGAALAWLAPAQGAAPSEPATTSATPAGVARGCPEVTVEEAPPSVEGGCVAELPPRPVRLTVLSMYGPVPFETCLVQLALHVSPAGEVWMPTFGADEEGRRQGACGDIEPCRWTGGDEPIYMAPFDPWRGTIERAGGRDVAVLDTCFDTCLGRFEGKLRIGLVRKGGRWRASAAPGSVGESGLRLEGSWPISWER